MTIQIVKDVTDLIKEVGGWIGIGAIAGVIINHFLEKSRRFREMIFDQKKNVYATLLGKLKTYYFGKGLKAYQSGGFGGALFAPAPNEYEDAIEETLSEAQFLAEEDLRNKLENVRASYLLNDWVRYYGMKKEEAIKDLELSMRKELKIY